MLFLLLLTSTFLSAANPPTTFIISHHEPQAGFFACFIGALNTLQWCIRNNKTPVIYWDDSFIFYDPQGLNGITHNCWEYYFEPISALSYKPGDIVHKTFYAPDGSYIYSWKEPELIRNKYWVKKTLIDPFIRVKEPIQKKVDTFYETHMKGKKTVGIHLRGTDKSLEVKQIAPESILAFAAQETDCQFFIATDEEKIVKLANQLLPGKIITYECYRSTDSHPIHMQKNLPYNRALIGEEVLITALLLARCDTLIHTNSNVAIAALYFNPEMKNLFLLSEIRDGKGNVLPA